jgi:2-dehydro-3-deoxygluconokinase
LILFSGITLAILPPGDRAALISALEEARARGSRIAFDPNLRPRLWSNVAEMCAGVSKAAGVADIVLPSFDDEATHFGDADPQATIARYRDAGAMTVVVKNGCDTLNAWDATDGTSEFCPQPVVSRDTTAAGDSFNAAFLAARLQGATLGDAVAAGAALAAKVVQMPGALVEAAAG